MAHVAKHFKAFRMGSYVWVPGSSCLAQRWGQGPGSTGISEGGGTYMGFNLIRRLQVVFPASPCFPAQMDHSGVQEAEVWPEDWVPRGSVRAYIGGLGRYSMIMIQLSVYDQFPKQKDFALNPFWLDHAHPQPSLRQAHHRFEALSLFHRSYQAGSKSTSNWMKLRLISYVNYSILILSLRSNPCFGWLCRSAQRYSVKCHFFPRRWSWTYARKLLKGKETTGRGGLKNIPVCVMWRFFKALCCIHFFLRKWLNPLTTPTNHQPPPTTTTTANPITRITGRNCIPQGR